MATLVTTAIAVLVTVERANQWTIKNSWLIRSLRRTNDWCQFKPIHSTNWSTIYKHVSITSRPGRYSPSCTRTRVPCRECGKSKLILLSHWLRRRQRRCSRQQRPLLLGSIGEGAPGRGGSTATTKRSSSSNNVGSNVSIDDKTTACYPSILF